MATDPASPSAQWLTCVTTLPTDEPASRMRLLRMLESLGCAVMREGVYLLPDTPQNRESLTRLREHIARAGGSATMLCITAIDDRQAVHFQQQFDRTSKYESLIAVITGLKAGFGVSDPAAIAKVLAKQKRELENITALDFFPSPIREEAVHALAEAEASVRTLMFPDNPAAVVGGNTRRTYSQQIWATRPPLTTDRLASAWLIRRFVDTEAKFIWLEKSQSLPPPALGFGFEGAGFSNGHGEVTFERLLHHFRLGGDAALRRMASLVHFLEAGGAPVPEAAGVETLLQGAKRRSLNEDNLLAESEKTFELLYDAYYESTSHP